MGLCVGQPEFDSRRLHSGAGLVFSACRVSGFDSRQVHFMSDDLESLLLRSVENPTARTPLFEAMKKAPTSVLATMTAPVQPERQAWLDERRKGIGGSEIAALLGLDPFRGALDVYLSKAEGWDAPETEDMIRGQVLEAGVLEWYGRRTQTVVAPNSSTIQHPTRPLIRCTHDAMAQVSPLLWQIVSVKCPRRGSEAWGDFDGSTRFPSHHALQLQWEHAVLTAANFHVAPMMHLAALVDGDLRIYHCEADTELQAVLLEQAEQWWGRHVIARVPPELDGSDGARAWIRRRFPGDSNPVRPATLEEEVLLEQMSEAAQAVSAADATFAVARQRVEESIGAASGITGTRVSVTWRKTAKGTRMFKPKYDWKTK